MNDKNGNVMKREDIPERYRWRLEDIYDTDDKWELEYKKIKDMLPNLSGYKGRPSFGRSRCNLLRWSCAVGSQRYRIYGSRKITCISHG
jgi:oligoendopeptidase F